MARLLMLLLTCARGAAGVMDALDIKAVCEVPTDGGPRKIYLDMDAEAFETLAGPPGPGKATLDWYVGSKTCDDDASRVESMTFTFPPDATDGTMSACVVTNGAGSDEECSVGGQACSRAIQYHEFLPDQTPIHIHEYCECT